MLILKQNSANSVPTPPAGKGTIFLDDSDTLSVKTSDGNVETFPTVAAANTQVVFIDGTSLSGNANFIYNKNTDTLTLTGTLATGNVKTDNLLYANGSPWDLSDPGGSNTQIQFNDDESFGGSAAFTFNKSSNLVSMGGGLSVTGNASAGNLSTGGVLSATGNANVGNLGTGGLIVATGNITGGNLVTAGTANVGELTASGNAVITGNLTVNGNVTYVNVDTLQVEDPVISLGGGPNGAPLTSNDGKDRGTLLNYYTTSAIDAFMGWDNSNGEFSFGSNVSIVNDVVTFNTLGNVRVGNIIGNGQALTGLTGANVTGQVGNALVAGTVYTAAQPNITSVGTLSSLGVSGNITAANITANTGVFTGNAAGLTNIPAGNISGQVANALVAGTVYTAAQPNITSVGKLTELLAGTDAASADFPNAISIFSENNTGVQATDNFGLVGEATGDSSNVATTGVGIFGIGKANGGTRGTGVQGFATVTNSADTGAAVGVRGYATTTHSGGYNIGVLGNAAGSGYGNYAFYVQAGNIGSIETDTAWDLNDNSATSLSFNSSGKAGILALTTVDGSEGVTMSGTLSVTGNATVGGIKTNNYYYANGSPVDFQQAGGSNTQVQFNDADGFGGSAAFTFDKTTNAVSMGGTLTVTGNASAGNLSTGGVLSVTGNANVGNLGTAGLITATGNVSGGNLTTAGAVAATGNVSGGNLTTAGAVAATGNVSGGNLSTVGALSVTGNANVGNIGGNIAVFTGNVSGGNLNTAGKVVASTLESNVADGTAPLVVASTTKVANLNADLLDGYSTATAATANTVVVRDADGSFTANVITANVFGQANTAVTAATVTTAAQPNITSVGTLSSLSATGNIAAGNVNAGNLLTANYITGTLTTAAQPNVTSVGTLTGLSVDGSNITLANGVYVGNGSGLSALAGANVTGQVGNALVAGTVYTAAQPNITSVGTLTGLGVNGTITGVNITANTGVFTGNGSGLSALAGGNVTGQVANALVAGTVYTAAQPNITSVGTLTGLGVNGNITAANITANTGVFTGNGSGLSALAGANVTGQVGNALVAGTVYTNAQPNITSVGTLSSLAVTGNATAGNVYANSGTIGASLLTGTLTTAAQPNITSVGTLSSLSVTGNVAAGNLTTVGILSVTGTGTSSIAGNLDMTSNNITNLAEPVNPSDAATKQYVDNVAEGLHTHDSCNAATTGTLATISGGTVTYNNGTAGVGANLVTTGSYTTIDGVTLSDGMRILVKNEANAAHNGIYVRSNSTVLTRATDFDTPAEMAGGDFTFVNGGTLYDNTGWVMPDPVTTVGTTNVVWVQFSGAGTYTAGTGLTLNGSQFNVNASQTQVTALGNVTTGTWNSLVGSSATFAAGLSGANLASITGANVTGQVGNALVAGTVYTAAQPNITSVGTLTSLGVNGTVTAVAFTANTGVFTGNGSGLSALAGGNVTGQVGNALVAGTVYTAAQPNITSVGTLTSVAVTGNATAGNVYANSGTIGASLLTGTLTTAAQPNVTSLGTLTGLGVNGNITAANITANTGVFTGNGSGLSALNASNLSSGTVPSARLTGAYSISVDSATTAGTVTTAAQPNITSVGSLTGLTMAANADITLSGTNADITGANLVSATTLTGTLSTAAQTNITSVGTLTGLGVNGTVTAVNITANTGVFTGNGSALSALNASNISSGTLAQARLANASLTVNGVAIALGGSGTVTASTTNTLTLGSYLTGGSFNGGSAVTAAVDATTTNTASKIVARDASGNFAAGTITATLSGAATTAGTVTTAAQPNITSVGTLSSLAVTGNITAGNLSVSTGAVTLGTLTTGANTTAGTITGNWTLSAGSRWNATYADLAEKYVADAHYEPGTVLVFGGEHEVTLANEFDSTRVAGVVTTDPAFSMNSECTGEHVAEIALQGRVPCKVHGPVAKGDLMVAGQNGHAVANNMARAGTIIGKALQNFEGGSGVIEVAVGRF